ncbi:MAG: HAMP domain-containing histidine kinase [Candidatus Lokiarchaeota archaeon]|nr:HAMP domain-containing histidine kinase [Candidatus Lokiarchaeota archaeon]
MSTKYAPAGRAAQTEIDRQRSYFTENETVEVLLGKIPAVFLILNNHRQIVYMNKGALEFSGLEEISSAIGKRPGELLDCVHSKEEVDGCGTAEACTFCGAVDAVLASQKGKPAVRDARLLVGEGHKAFDLRIWAVPLKVEDENFTALTIQDIRQEKRLMMIERIFYHDILNTITGLAGNISLLRKYKDKVNVDEMLKQVDDTTQRLIDEIQSQQMLTAAESATLAVRPSTFTTKAIIGEVALRFAMTELTKDKKVEIDERSEVVTITTDKAIIGRILVNMVKNALESTPAGGTVLVGCKRVDGRVQFKVHNGGFIPRDVQLQIFNRSFSTKGRDRGLGTYGMMLLSHLLKGTVSFTTSRERGTTFTLDIPERL